MKKLYDKLCMTFRRVSYNIFGQIGNCFAFGGILATCCGIYGIGIPFLAVSATGYLFSFGKIALDRHQAEQEEKYFGDDDGDEVLTYEKYKSAEKQAEEEETKDESQELSTEEVVQEETQEVEQQQEVEKETKQDSDSEEDLSR